MSDTTKTILLDLAQRGDTKSFEKDGDFIQQIALSELRRLLIRQLQDAVDTSKVKHRDEPTIGIISNRRHEAIAIHGRRGSGKTTFILGVLKLLEQGWKRDGDKDLPGKVKLLGILDPTMIETKEHILVNVISRINHAVDRYREYEAPSGLAREIVEKEWNAWQEALKNLAEALPLLDDVGGAKLMGEAWENPQYVMQKGLRNARSGADLEKNFHTFVDRALDILGKDAFVLALDDIDTRFPSGWPVLEVLRKYLTSPRLIVLISGNLELYSMLVRDKQWANFGEAMLRHDRKGRDQINAMIGELQEQYLQKIMPSSNRIELLTLSYFARESVPYKVQVKLLNPETETSTTQSLELTEVLQEVGRNAFFLTRDADLMLFSEILLHQPTRSVLAVLDVITPDLATKRPEQLTEAYWRAIEDLHNTLPDVFSEAMYESKVSTDKLQFAAHQELIPLVIEFLNRNTLWENGYRLKPEYLDERRNLVLLTLGAKLAREMSRHPAMLLEYFLKIGATHEAVLTVDKARPDPTVYTKFVGLHMHEPPIQVARRALAVQREGREKVGVHQGSIALYARDSGGAAIKKKSTTKAPAPEDLLDGFYQRLHDKNSNWSGDRGYRYNDLRSLRARIVPKDGYSHSSFVALPACNVFNARGHSTRLLSIHNLLGAIAAILEERDLAGVTSLIPKLAQIRSFPMPNWTETRLAPPESPEQADEAQPSSLNPSFLAAVDAWRLDVNRLAAQAYPLPTHVVAKMWTRFHYTLARTDATYGKDWTGLHAGFLMHRFIVAFLNALLVEEHLHRYSEEGKIALDNPSGKDDLFKQNLNVYLTRSEQEREKAYPVFTMFFRCPLWALYLNPETPAGKAPKKGKAVSSEAPISLWEYQLDAWVNYISEPAMSKEESEVNKAKEARSKSQRAMLQVAYHPEKSATPESSAVFDNLYWPLNSLLVLERIELEPQPKKEPKKKPPTPGTEVKAEPEQPPST